VKCDSVGEVQFFTGTRVDPTRVGGGQLSLPGVSWYKPTYDVMGPGGAYAPANTVMVAMKNQMRAKVREFT
jgi:hypothetical protein